MCDYTATKAKPMIFEEKDPFNKNPHDPGAKLDHGKQLSWLFISGFGNALDAVAEVTTFGASKYSPGGWRQVDDGANRYMEAFGRHMIKLASGETIDESGCLHKAQMIWNLLASLELEIQHKK